MSRIKALSAIGVGAVMAISLMSGATSAQAGEMENCINNGVGANNVSCVTYTKLPGTASNGQVRVNWQVLPGTDMTSLQGGIWYSRAPIAGESAGTQSDAYPNQDSNDTCSAWAEPRFVGCVTTYQGLSGSTTLSFPLAMAGYRYVIHQSEYMVDADGNVASGSGNSDFTNDSVWVHKAYRYKYKGKTYTSRKCPPRAQKACTPIVNLVLNNDVGTGMPVSPVD